MASGSAAVQMRKGAAAGHRFGCGLSRIIDSARGIFFQTQYVHLLAQTLCDCISPFTYILRGLSRAHPSLFYLKGASNVLTFAPTHRNHSRQGGLRRREIMRIANSPLCSTPASSRKGVGMLVIPCHRGALAACYERTPSTYVGYRKRRHVTM